MNYWSNYWCIPHNTTTMKNLFILAFVLGSLSSFAQNRFTISGYISDDANGEALVAANIWSPDARVGTSTNGYGFYSLTLPAGKHIVQLQYLGYATQNFEVRPAVKYRYELPNECRGRKCAQ